MKPFGKQEDCMHESFPTLLFVGHFKETSWSVWVYKVGCFVGLILFSKVALTPLKKTHPEIIC